MSSPGYSPRHLHPLYVHPVRRRKTLALPVMAMVLTVITVATILLPSSDTDNTHQLARSGFASSAAVAIGLVLLIGGVVLLAISKLDYKLGYRALSVKPPAVQPSESGELKP